MLTVAGSVAVLPALSVTVPVTVWAWPSSVTCCGPVQPATPDTASEQLNVMVTAVLFHPSALAAGSWVCPIVGELLSMPNETDWWASSLPARSVLQNSSVCRPSVLTGTEVPVAGEPPSRT